MRENIASFESNVRTSLRGGALRIAMKDKPTQSVSFPKLL